MLCDLQFGFNEGRSREDTRVYLLVYINNSLGSKLKDGVAILNLVKAFDYVSHNI